MQHSLYTFITELAQNSNNYETEKAISDQQQFVYVFSHSFASAIPPAVIANVASLSGISGLSHIFATRVSPRPLRSIIRVVDACAST